VDRLRRPTAFGAETPGAIGQIVKGKWYNYYSDGQAPTSCCDSGEYYYFYDALGNVNGVLDSGGHYYRWEMDAFGNDLPSGNDFLAMDQPGPKEHLTGKMCHLSLQNRPRIIESKPAARTSVSAQQVAIFVAISGC